MAKCKFKVGDKIVGKWGGETFSGVIENIEYDESHNDYVADLDSGRWCYLTSIIRKA